MRPCSEPPHASITMSIRTSSNGFTPSAAVSKPSDSGIRCVVNGSRSHHPAAVDTGGRPAIGVDAGGPRKAATAANPRRAAARPILDASVITIAAV